VSVDKREDHSTGKDQMSIQTFHSATIMPTNSRRDIATFLTKRGPLQPNQHRGLSTLVHTLPFHMSTIVKCR
jgi:hypothetical protein